MFAILTFISKYWSQLLCGLLSALFCFIIMGVGYERLRVTYTKCKNELHEASNRVTVLNETVNKLQKEVKNKTALCNKRVAIYNKKAMEFKSLYEEGSGVYGSENCSDTICSQLNRMWHDTEDFVTSR